MVYTKYSNFSVTVLHSKMKNLIVNVLLCYPKNCILYVTRKNVHCNNFTLKMKETVNDDYRKSCAPSDCECSNTNYLFLDVYSVDGMER